MSGCFSPHIGRLQHISRQVVNPIAECSVRGIIQVAINIIYGSGAVSVLVRSCKSSINMVRKNLFNSIKCASAAVGCLWHTHYMAIISCNICIIYYFLLLCGFNLKTLKIGLFRFCVCSVHMNIYFNRLEMFPQQQDNRCYKLRELAAVRQAPAAGRGRESQRYLFPLLLVGVFLSVRVSKTSLRQEGCAPQHRAADDFSVLMRHLHVGVCVLLLLLCSVFPVF